MSEDDIQTCQVCDRQANYLCGDCKSVAYCSTQHRTYHWKTHKEQCKVMQRNNERYEQEKANQQRSIYRKQYFQNYSNKIYDDCLVTALKLLDFQKSHIKKTKNIFNQFQYGISVTLLCRTYIVLHRFQNAEICINQYIKQKLHFLQDLRDIPQLKDTKDSFTANTKDFFNKKLSLVASIANIYYTLKLSCINYYIIYAKHIQFAFGSESLEHSNCFFMMGSYYKEKKQYNKSIACFLRAANIRGTKGGDCYFNLGILYYLQKKSDVAIKMFQNSIYLKKQEEGEGTIQIAKIYEKIATIHSQNNYYKSAIESNQKALKIYSNKKQMHDYDLVREKIKQLHSKLKNYLQTVDKQTLSKDIREAMGDAQLLKKLSKQNEDQIIPQDRVFLQQKRKQAAGRSFEMDKVFKLSQTFLNRLNSIEIFRLSQLQLQLQKCKSQFAVAYTIRNSQFLKKISPNRLNQMKNQNEKLFQLMNIQMKPVIGKQKKPQTQN